MRPLFLIILFAFTNTLSAQSLFKGDSSELNIVYFKKNDQKTNNKWYSKEFEELKETDDSAYYYLQYVVEGNHIQKKIGTKAKLLQNINYVAKQGEYLFDGIAETQEENGVKTFYGKFKEGLPLEAVKSWFADGKPKSVYPINGVYKVYDEKGQTVYEGPIENGLGNGIFISTNSYAKTTYTYKKGIESGLRIQSNNDGKIVRERYISPLYESPRALEEGLQVIKAGNRYGFIDRTGKIVIPVKYDSMPGSFYNGESMISIIGGYIRIDRKGTITYDSRFEEVGNFHEGLATVKKNKKMGFINEEGKIVIPLVYDYADYFAEGLAYVVTKTEPYTSVVSFIDKTNTKILTLKGYEAYSRQFHDGLFAVKNSDGWGYIDRSGRTVIKNQYSACGKDFDNGFATVGVWVGSGTKYGIIDRSGKEIFPLKYFDISDGFAEGIFCVKEITGTNFKFGAVDKSGKIIVPFIYDRTRNIGNGLISVDNDDKSGAVNALNKIIIPIKYDLMGRFSEGLCIVVINEKYGYVNANGVEVIPAKYDRVWPFENGEAIVKLDGKEFHINTKGERLY